MELTLRAHVKCVQFGCPAELALGKQRKDKNYMK
jgi:hypothetical protein